MDAIDLYVRDVGRYATLSWDEQLALFRRRPDPDAERRLVEANLKLVVSVVYKLRRPRDVFEDLIQAGNLGLMRAVKKFDPDRGFKFSTYATKTIWVFVHRCRYQNRLIYLGIQHQGRSKDLEAYAIRDSEITYFSELSCDSVFDPSNSSLTDPALIALDRDQVEWINTQMENLTGETKQILELRKSGISYREIGKRLGVSPHRVRQILSKLRDSLTCSTAV